MPATDEFAKGPDVGHPLPDFTLPDQTGTMVNFDSFRDGRRAMVMFHRSAGW
jgi:peroxiredoxin